MFYVLGCIFALKMANYIEVNPNHSIKDIINKSEDDFVIIFKHSPRCIISKWAWRDFEAAIAQTDLVFLVDVINCRGLSNELASHLQIIHQSPQVLVLKKGVCVYHASHQDIDYHKVKNMMN